MEAIIQFLNPTTDLISLTIMIFISISIMLTLIGVVRSANSKNWQCSWDNKTTAIEDDLDAEHGSIYDLSDAVSTRWEQWAVSLPGVYLVLGMLGTFIGIGLALNNCSQIDFASATAESLSAMTDMLSGLGMQFKTSVYGVMGFLLLKFIYSVQGSDKRRLRWCISKSKEQINRRNEHRNQEEVTRFELLKNELSSSLKDIVNAIGNSNETLKKVHNTSEKLCTDITTSQSTIKSAINESKAALINSNSVAHTHLSNILQEQKNIGKNSEETRKQGEQLVNRLSGTIDILKETVNSFSTEMKKAVVDMAESTGTLGNAAVTMKNSSNELKQSVDKFGPQVKECLDDIKNKFVKSMSVASEDMSNKMKSAAQEICSGVNVLKEVSIEGQNHLNESLEKLKSNMKDSSDTIHKISVTLLDTTDTIGTTALAAQNSIDEIGRDIKSNIGDLTANNKAIKNVEKMLTESLNKFHSELESTRLVAEKFDPKAHEILLYAIKSANSETVAIREFLQKFKPEMHNRTVEEIQLLSKLVKEHTEKLQIPEVRGS